MAGKLSTRLKGWLSGAGAEGSWRGPFYGLTEFDNWRQVGPLDTGWQRNLRTGGARHVASVYACVMLNARAVSQCEPMHMRAASNGAHQRVTTSPASRILRKPNGYEHWAQMILNTVAELLFEGEALWYVTRDDRQAITAAHRLPRQSWSIHVDPDSKEIFYGIGNYEDLMTPAPNYMIPARDCCHFRMHTPRHPLIGESPVKAASLAVGINVALNQSQLAFFSNMNRPSGVMTTDERLTAEQMKQLREAFNNVSKDMNAGGMPILANGLKFQATGVSQNDAQLIEQQRLSVAEIARVYGVPMALLAESSGPQAGTEALISHWLSIGLGSVIETVERSLDRLFDLGADETIQLDPSPLLRADMQARVDALTKAVQGGIMTIDEARSKEWLGPIKGGDRAFLQRQMTPVDVLLELSQNELNPPEPEPAPVAEPTPDPSMTEDEAKAIALAVIRKAMSA